jgi:hypothetical protein
MISTGSKSLAQISPLSLYEFLYETISMKKAVKHLRALGMEFH